MSTSLANITAASRALAKASTLDDVLDIRDKMEAFRAYAKASKQGLHAQNLAAEIKLRAERKAGEMLAEMELQHGSRGVGKKVESQDVTSLNDLGITKMQSSRWQLAAKLPESKYSELVQQCNESGRELTQSIVLKESRKLCLPSETIDKTKTQKQNDLELVATARASFAKLADLFGDQKICLLISVLRSELENLEVLANGNS